MLRGCPSSPWAPLPRDGPVRVAVSAGRIPLLVPMGGGSARDSSAQVRRRRRPEMTRLTEWDPSSDLIQLRRRIRPTPSDLAGVPTRTGNRDRGSTARALSLRCPRVIGKVNFYERAEEEVLRRNRTSVFDRAPRPGASVVRERATRSALPAQATECCWDTEVAVTLVSMGLTTIGVLALSRLSSSFSCRMPADRGPHAWRSLTSSAARPPSRPGSLTRPPSPQSPSARSRGDSDA